MLKSKIYFPRNLFYHWYLTPTYLNRGERVKKLEKHTKCHLWMTPFKIFPIPSAEYCRNLATRNISNVVAKHIYFDRESFIQLPQINVGPLQSFIKTEPDKSSDGHSFPRRNPTETLQRILRI